MKPITAWKQKLNHPPRLPSKAR